MGEEKEERGALLASLALHLAMEGGRLPRGQPAESRAASPPPAATGHPDAPRG